MRWRRPPLCIRNHAHQVQLGEVVDFALNGTKHQRAQYAFFIFVAPYDPKPEEDDTGCIVANQPAAQVVPLMIDWIQRYAPGRITVNELH